MKDLISMALCYQNGSLKILDQSKLPAAEIWETCETPEQMHLAIRELKVRGAPLIGIAAVLLLALLTEKNIALAEIHDAAAYLMRARPTASNLMFCINRFMKSLASSRAAAIATAETIFLEDIALCQAIAGNGLNFIQDGDAVMTHCNSGGLATAGLGTALGVIKAAFAAGKNIHVYVNETRPLLQGARLTAWELEQANIPFTLICDNMAASIMQQQKIKSIFVGADRIAANGDFANKIGTYNLAVLAHYHAIPFYACAPYTTVDNSCVSGAEIIIEERSPEEITGITSNLGHIYWSPRNCPVFNPAFDITPAHLVSAYILDKGIYTCAQEFALNFSK